MRTKLFDGNSNLESKLFRIGSWVSVIICVALVVLDGLIFKHREAVLLEFAAICLFSYFLWLSYRKNNNFIRYLFLGLILFFANGAFFVEGGWATPSAVIFFIGILFGTIVIDSKHSKVVVLILITNFILLTIIEFFIFNEPKYLSYTLEEFKVVHAIFALISIIVTVLLIDFFKVMYDRERYAINLVNKQLDEANKLLDQKNENLVSAEISIKERQEVLARNHEQLEEVNSEIEDINKYLEETVQRRRDELSKINSDLSMLFYRSSHDFRRPLTTLKGLARIGKLTEQSELSSKILELVDHTADAMRRMLDKFLMLYQINDLQRFSSVSFEEMHTNLVKQTELFDGIDLSFEINTAQYKSNDRRNFLLDIILQNLVENSCFYRKEGRSVIKIEIKEQDGQLYVSVWDNGDGIPDEIQDKIFNIYYRGNLKSKGAGLGLFVVKNAIKILNAVCRIKSIHKEYCQFDIRFKI